MKKRIISLFLLVAMILTMIPVMASAAETEATAENGSDTSTETNEATAGDLHDWYVQKGLTALYSTFGADNGVDLTAGTWTSKVGTGVATLGKKDRWSVGEYGGVGFTVLYGTVDETGAYTTTSDYNNTNSIGLKLDFGIAQMPLGDSTVEYLAMYKPIYVADTDGSILVKNGAKVEAYDAFAGALPTGWLSSQGYAVDNVGWYSSFTNRIDGICSVYSSQSRGQIFWIFDNPTWYAGRNGHRLTMFVTNDAYQTNNLIRTYDIRLDETLTETPATDVAEATSVTTASFGVYRDAVLYRQIGATTASTGADAYYAAGTAFKSNAAFTLSHARPTDFFGVRVYNRALSTAEMSQNRSVDILLYYGIELTEEQVANEDLKTAVLATAASYSFETDATAKKATALKLAAAVEDAQAALDVINLYADPDHITSFYTTFIDGMVNIENGTWIDLVGGGAATMGVPSRWFENADGSFGYNAFVGYIKADGTQSMGGSVNSDKTAIDALGNVPTANHAYWKNNALTFGMDKLPADDFTFEYLAMYKPYYVADASKSTADQIVYAKDANGNYLEAYDVFGSTPATTDYGSIAGRAVDSIGHYTTITQQVDGSSGWGGSVRGTQHWLFRTHAWANKRNWVGSGSWGQTSGLATMGDPFKQNDVPTVYAITLDETVAEDSTVSGNFGLYRNGLLYGESDVITWDGTETNPVYTGEYDSASEFYLSCCQPTDFYAARVYDKVLSNAEKQQNVAIDVILYYGITVDPKILADEELASEVYAVAASYTFETDATLKNANKAKLTKAIELVATRAEVMAIDNTLYVKDGLTSLFTAFERDVEYSVAMINNNYTWANRVKDGASATFKGGEVWSLGEYGGVEKTYIRGTMTDGVWALTNNTSTANTDITKDYSLYFGLDMLPKDDFTVEYLAYFPPMYAVDTATGELVEHYNGTYTEMNGVYNVDRIGFVEFNTVYPGGKFDNMNNYLRGRIAPAACSTWGGDTGGGTYGFGGTSFRIDRDSLKIDSYAVIRDETTVTDVNGAVTEVRANYATAYNGVVKYRLNNFSSLNTGAKQGLYESSTSYKDGAYYTYDDDTTFYLSRSAGATFYAVRIYDRALSEAEMAQNRAADIAGYYDLTISAVVLADDDLIARCVAVLASAPIATDYSAKTATKAKLQAAIDEIVAIATAEEICDYDSLYVQDDLVALYTSFVGDDSADLVTGEWANKVEGGEAAILNGAYWQKKLVGIGYTMDTALWTSAGQYSGIVLSNEYAELSNFTVEAFATVIGVTDDNGDRYINDYQPAVKDEGGNIITPAQGRQYGWYKTGVSAFRFDMLASLFFSSYDKNTPLQSLTSRWYLMDAAYHDNGIKTKSAEVTTDFDAINLDVETGWSAATPDSFLPKLMTVTRTTAGGTETYTLSYNGTVTKTGELTAADRAIIEASTKAADETNRFTLFNALPSTVYAIRVYSDTLTDAEKLQNSFVDKAAYFKVDLTGFADLDDATKARVYEAFASVSLNQEEAAVKALYDFYANTDIDKLAAELVTVDGYLPILAGASGYRVLFKLNDDAVALLRGADYEVSYGALVAAGGKYRALEDVTVGADGVKTIAVGGEDGSGIYYNLAGAGGHYYTATVTANDAAYYGVDMIVRGYVQITEPDGDVKTYYVDVYENEVLDGEASILDVADYFVNDFDGNVATQYEYMNSAALRAILREYGYASRVSLADDLALYVAVTGDDENDGLTENTPYATLEAAFAAAKAHLGKSGRKTVVINVTDGEYRISEALTLSGDEILADAYSFTVKATGENVVINALTEIDRESLDWDGETGAAVVQLPADENGEYPALRAVYGDGELLDISHWGDADNFGVIEGIRFEDANGGEIEPTVKDWGLDAAGAAACKYVVYQLPLDAITQDVSAYEGAELHHSQAWTFHIAIIDHVELLDEYAEAYVLFGNVPRNYHKNYNVTGTAFWLENSAQLMYENSDTYYYDQESGKLYFMEDNIYVSDLASYAYASLENLIVLDDVKNVTFDGITFSGVDAKHLTGGTTVSMGQAGNMTLSRADGTTTKVGFPTAGAIYGNNVSNLTVKNATFTEMLGGGINLRGVSKDITIDSNVFTNLGDSAIRVGSSAYTMDSYTNGLAITNNYVNTVATLYKASVAVQSFAVANATVVGNTVTNVPYSAFSFGWIWATIDNSAEGIIAGGKFSTFNMEIAYNYVTDFMTCMGDGGAFYLLGGNVSRSENDTTFYNFMHHNYVNMSQQTGLHVDNENTKRFTMGYYHDNSSSHWFDYENVLINSSTGTFSTYWLQDLTDCETHSIKLLDNYLVGINKTTATGTWNMNEIYVSGTAINADFHVSANDYIYENVAALQANTSIGVVTYGDAVTKASTATAADDVAAIFAACGSSLAPEGAHVSALDWEADAAERVLLSDTTASVDATKAETETVTFTDGETTATAIGVVGTTVVAPYEFRSTAYNYTFTVGGEAIDLATWTIPEGGATVTVEAELITYQMTLTDANYVSATIKLGVGEKLVLPEVFVREGYTTVLKAEGQVLDIETFTMPERDLEVKVSYEINKHTVTITDGTTTKVITDAYGTTLPKQAANFVKMGYNTVFSVNGMTIVDGTFKIPDNDVTINVTYTPKTYDVKFVNKIGANETVYATVQVVFGQAITLPETPATWSDDTYEYTFVGWYYSTSSGNVDYSDGMILETEGMTFYTTWTATEKTPDLITGDINGDGVVDISDITAVISAASGTELDPEQYPGNTELTGDGVVDISDITAVIAIASGSSAEA